MRHLKNLVFYALSAFFSVQAIGQSSLIGYVTAISDGRVQFSTARTDYTLDLSRLPKESRSTVNSSEARTSIISIAVPPDAIVNQTEISQGVRADCTELPFSYRELEDIARRSDIRNIEDFLRAIPAGTMQGFTFIYNSLSLQRGEGDSMVRPESPRVLRMNKNGTVTFSYTSDPNSDTYNGVEVLYFDEESEEFRTSSFRLGASATDRIKNNPRECETCHAVTTINGKPSLKPNWPEYFFWSDCQDNRQIGMYGMSDDNMAGGVLRARIPTTPNKNPPNCSGALDSLAHERQVQNYRNFLTNQSANACFQLLPWPTDMNSPPNPGTTWDYSVYPYSTIAQQRIGGFQNYHLRTNARITDMYSHLMSKRIARIIRDNPLYERIKYYLQLEAADCGITEADESEIRRLIPGINLRRRDYNPVSDYLDSSKARILFGFGEVIGLSPSDWSMEFERDNSPVYNAVMFLGRGAGDANISDVVQGVLFTKLAETSSDLASVSENVLTRGITEVFGANFSCIDDMGGAIRADRRGPSRALCQQLRTINTSHVAQLEIADLQPNIQDPNPSESLPLSEEFSLSQAELASAARGRTLVQSGNGRCIECHSRTESNLSFRPESFLFIPNDSLPSEVNDTALETLRERIEEGFMDDIR